MDASDALQRLRRQRNAAAWSAVLLLVATIGTVLPRALANYRALRQANGELVDLQDQLLTWQSRVVASQQDLAELERRILAAQGK